MQALKCELCGSNDVVKKDGLYVCQHCGTKYSLDEAKKLLGTVKIDSSEELKNLYAIARRAKESNDSENAAKYYDLIMQKDPSSWEAAFYNVYYRAMDTSIAGIASTANAVTNSFPSIVSLIKNGNDSSAQKSEHAIEMIARISIIATMMESAARKTLKSGIDGTSSIISSYLDDYVSRGIAVSNMLLELGDIIDSRFSGDPNVQKAVVAAWKLGLQHFVDWNCIVNSDCRVENLQKMKPYSDKVRKYEPSYNLPSPNLNGFPWKLVYVVNQNTRYQPSNAAAANGATSSSTTNGGGCYVATAVYGSYDCPQVWVLRRYRDYTLAETWYGRAFIHIYYAISPTLVKWFGNTKWFTNLLKPTLDKKVSKLHRKGVADTPYQDKEW